MQHKDNMTLVPLIDMINHSSKENIAVSRVEDALEIRATRTIEENEEIMFSYHSDSCRFWVCEYGFWHQGNEFDDLDISLEIQSIVKGQKTWLESEGYWGLFLHVILTECREYTISMDGEVSFRIQVALRSVLVSNVDLVREFMEGKSDGKDQQGQVDNIVRKILFEKVKACKEALAREGPECIEDEIVRKLWDAELQLARIAQGKLTS